MIDSLIVISLWGGLLSSLTPCNILALPSFISYSINESTSPKKGFMLSVFYGLGYSLVFTLLGISILFIPGFIKNQIYLQIGGGVIVMVLGFYLFLRPEKTSCKYVPRKPKEEFNEETEYEEPFGREYWESFTLGLSYGTSGFGCVVAIFTPVLASIIASQNSLNGMFYLLLYSIGMMIPYILIGLFIGKFNQSFFYKIIKYQKLLERIFGTIIIIMGLLYMREGLILMGVWG
jgi:cytochrome c-type biogenesis protein